MRIAGVYSFKRGLEVMESQYPNELQEIREVIDGIDASILPTKISAEKSMVGRELFSPGELNKAFREALYARGWVTRREACIYPVEYYSPDYSAPKRVTSAFREMDFVKNRVGIEVQLGKYAFMVYNVAAKMTIFHNLGIIDVGIEIVPVRELAAHMSTGVSYFEQFVWDLDHRGVADIDIPVLILGIVPEALINRKR